MPKLCKAPADCPFEAEKVAHIYAAEGYTLHLHNWLALRKRDDTRLRMLYAALCRLDGPLGMRLLADITLARHNGPPLPQISRHTPNRHPDRATGAPTP